MTSIRSDLKSVIKVMLLTGQSSQWHNWVVSSPKLREILERAGGFEVETVKTPAKGEDFSEFAPDFDAFDVVVLDYEGDDWPVDVQQRFEAYVKNGGGLVIFHATDNAFPSWPEFNEMIAVGGWGDRDPAEGSMLRWRDGEVERDPTPAAAMHPAAYEFVVTTRVPEHPIMKGLPQEWLHAKDELYSQLRGPAKNVTVLATACADPAEVEGGTGENEPMLMAIDYGKGRVFHTTLGHVHFDQTEVPASMRCAGFEETFIRGTEWAATGEVKRPAPEDFPSAKAVSIR